MRRKKTSSSPLKAPHPKANAYRSLHDDLLRAPSHLLTWYSALSLPLAAALLVWFERGALALFLPLLLGLPMLAYVSTKATRRLRVAPLHLRARTLRHYAVNHALLLTALILVMKAATLWAPSYEVFGLSASAVFAYYLGQFTLSVFAGARMRELRRQGW